jgi:hypothetical protein
MREIKTKFQLERHRSDPHRWEDNIKREIQAIRYVWCRMNAVVFVFHNRETATISFSKMIVPLRELKRPSSQM